jgi:hypothetical protein
MSEPPPDLRRRLLFILHRGLVEARNLAFAGRTEQLADLADALEILPCLMLRWDDQQMAMVRFVLKNYEEKYPVGRFDYSPYLSEYDVPDQF